MSHAFADPELLRQAVTHRSWCAEHAGSASNERLEFLGDAVLGIVITDDIYRRFPELHEGALAKVRAAVVSEAPLAAAAAAIPLGPALRLGKGEDASGGRGKPSILSDALEAVFGAIYLDAGLDAVAPIVLDLLDATIAEAAEGPGGHDFKTRLQELAARDFDAVPHYEVQAEGPDHDKRFYAVVSVGGNLRGAGEGRSKKQAEQAAARAACDALADATDERAAARVGASSATASEGDRDA